MGFFARTTRRRARPVDAASATGTSSTSPSEGGPTSSTQSQYHYLHIAIPAKLDGLEAPTSPPSSTGQTKSNSARTSGSASRLTRFGTWLSRSTAVFGIRRKGKKPWTASSFSMALEAETSALAKELTADINRQLWGEAWVGRKMPRFWKIRKHFHHHRGEWEYHEAHWYYEDCECCGQPVKHGWEERWTRRCKVCGAYESRDTIPVTHKKGGFRWRTRS